MTIYMYYSCLIGTVEELNQSDFELDDQIADINYMKKELLQMGVMPSQVGGEDLVELL